MLALEAIIDDVGADRGFLLSEVEFQSGAIQQARKRNITLTSIQDLREVAAESAFDNALACLAWRSDRAKAEIRRRYHQREQHVGEHLPPVHWYNLDYLSVVFDEVSRNLYPVVYWFDSRQKLELTAAAGDELIAGVGKLVSDAEAFLVNEYPAFDQDV